ncbi:hypothetical protein RI367_005164 [Sorochytrium milnesiophthora]
MTYVQMYFLVSSREIKRLDSGAKASICQHLGESITGIVASRAYGYQAQNIDRLESQVNIRATYANYSASHWLGVSVNAISAKRVPGALLVQLTGIVDWENLILFMMMLWRGLCDLDSNFVAVQRFQAHSTIPSEAAEHDVVPLNDDTSIQPMLRNLNLKICGGEKIGMCGRSGAGKSTVTLWLFRIIEAVAGSIEIDGQDISKVGLADLRSRLTIIPQDSMLFQGTVRSSLDPLSKHSDAVIWKALVLVNLREYVAAQEGKLRAEVKTGSSNFSAGQTQLFTLAAALLCKQRTVIFDEATSATDAETDAIVQHTIRSEFKDCTVLILAHRIATILDSDPILMLDQGQVAEFDTLQVLPQNLDSAFAKLGGRTKAQ